MTNILKLWFFTFRLGIINFVKGIDLYRVVEYEWLLENLTITSTTKFMEFGPWKSPIPTFLAKRGVNVSVVDVYQGSEIQRRLARRMKTNLITLTIPHLTGNCTFKLPNNTEKFNAVAIISTIEHFEGDVDSQIVEECYNKMEDGGKLFITVPYGLYTEGSHGGWFERRYDYYAVKKRLHYDKFKVEKEFYFRDSKNKRITALYWAVPKVVRFALGRLQFPLAKFLMSRDKATKEDAGLYGVVLVK